MGMVVLLMKNLQELRFEFSFQQLLKLFFSFLFLLVFDCFFFSFFLPPQKTKIEFCLVSEQETIPCGRSGRGVWVAI